jgi:hypothetical protein
MVDQKGLKRLSYTGLAIHKEANQKRKLVTRILGLFCEQNVVCSTLFYSVHCSRRAVVSHDGQLRFPRLVSVELTAFSQSLVSTCIWFPIWYSRVLISVSAIQFVYSVCQANTIPILMHQMRISTTYTQAKKVGNPGEKCENCIRAGKKTKYCAMKLSQIRRRIELCMREIILRFVMNL